MATGCFDVLADDLRAVLRLAAGRTAEPSTAILHSRTLHSTPKSGRRVGYDGARHKCGSRPHMAVDTLGHLHVTAASANDRTEVGRLVEAVQEATGNSVSLAYVDQGCPGEHVVESARSHSVKLENVKLLEARRGFVLLSRRWVVKLPFAWTTRFRHRARNYERYASTLADSEQAALPPVH